MRTILLLAALASVSASQQVFLPLIEVSKRLLVQRVLPMRSSSRAAPFNHRLIARSNLVPRGSSVWRMLLSLVDLSVVDRRVVVRGNYENLLFQLGDNLLRGSRVVNATIVHFLAYQNHKSRLQFESPLPDISPFPFQNPLYSQS